MDANWTSTFGLQQQLLAVPLVGKKTWKLFPLRITLSSVDKPQALTWKYEAPEQIQKVFERSAVLWWERDTLESLKENPSKQPNNERMQK